MKRFMIVASFALLTAAPLAAETYTAQNGVQVSGSGGSFTVSGSDGTGARGVWCAAGDFAQKVAGASSKQRLYVVSQAANRRSVQFSLSARGLKPSSVISIGNSVSTPGANLAIGHALTFCADKRLLQSNR